MRKRSDAQADRSSILQRSEQKGRQGFSSQAVSRRQLGHGARRTSANVASRAGSRQRPRDVLTAAGDLSTLRPVPPRPDTPTQLTTLADVLAAAAGLLRKVVDDTLFKRMVDVFTRMPAGDRETIIGVVEREVERRLLIDRTHGALTGDRILGPNPTATLYLRVLDAGDSPRPMGKPEIMEAAVRAARIVHGWDDHPLSEKTSNAISEAVAALPPGERASLRRFHHEMLGFLDDADRKP
jgi:hypothetical protein